MSARSTKDVGAQLIRAAWVERLPLMNQGWIEAMRAQETSKEELIRTALDLQASISNWDKFCAACDAYREADEHRLMTAFDYIDAYKLVNYREINMADKIADLKAHAEKKA